nr:hypothetical protein [Rhodopirellula sp. SM50]
MRDRTRLLVFSPSDVRKSMAFTLTVLSFCGLSPQTEAAETRKPNVVLIYIDDLGYGDGDGGLGMLSRLSNDLAAFLLEQF